MAKSEWATGVLEDEYRLGPSLGDSAWFEVRAAERLRTGEKAVVKRHFDHLLDDQRFVGSILATRRRLAALDHPALVGVLDAAWDGRQLWSAEQFVGGRSLTAWLSEGWVTPLLGLHITQRLLLLLDEVHRLGIVHGALHPGTVRMSGRTEPRLGDFGLPTADPELTGPRSTGSLAFYGAYCAPEVLSGAVAVPQSDLHSAGLLLGACLDADHEVPAGAAEIVRVATRERGYASAAAMAEAVAGVLRTAAPRGR